MRTRLTILAADIDYAKSIGARYDKEKKEFYVEDVEDLYPFLGWMNKRLLEPCKPIICAE